MILGTRGSKLLSSCSGLVDGSVFQEVIPPLVLLVTVVSSQSNGAHSTRYNRVVVVELFNSFCL